MKKQLRVTWPNPPTLPHANPILNQYLYSNSTKLNKSWAAQNFCFWLYILKLAIVPSWSAILYQLVYTGVLDKQRSVCETSPVSFCIQSENGKLQWQFPWLFRSCTMSSLPVSFRQSVHVYVLPKYQRKYQHTRKISTYFLKQNYEETGWNTGIDW